MQDTRPIEAAAAPAPGIWQTIRCKRIQLFKEYGKNKYLLLMLLPVVVWYLIFSYGPLWGIQLAFKDFRIMDGIGGSPWAGFKHFHYMFTASPDFPTIMRNTVLISLYHIVFGFPAPVVLALLLNELRSRIFTRIAQTITYMPYFFSWVIISSLAITVLSPSTGVVNMVVKWLGYEPIYFLASPDYFRSILVGTAIWKDVGYGAIVYLAALASIDPVLYEAAKVDGVGKWRQLWSITLPSILPVIVIMFLFRLMGILDAGFDQILNMYNPAVYNVSDIIDTYVYRVGLTQMQFSFTTAVGLFKNVVALVFVLAANWLIKRSGQEGLF
ncbi:MAG: sugar ABC transporter permease [Paenibacillaceae bacterium]|nr:sugar ABC transporter permease [Paenibacillaceae bacterium]